MTQLLGSRTVNETWNAFGATETKVLVIESREPPGGVSAMFDVRLRYGIEGVGSPVYSESVTVYLEPNNARIVDFRQRLGSDMGSVTNIGGMTVECRVNYAYPPILLQVFEIDLERVDRLFFLAGLDGKANSVHSHAIAQITGLVEALNGKLNSPATAPTVGQILGATDSGLQWINAPTGGGGGGPTSVMIEQITGLASRLLGLDEAIAARIPASIIGDPGGVAELDTAGQVPIAQLPTVPIGKISPTGATAGQVLGLNNGAIAWVTPASAAAWTERNTNGTIAAGDRLILKTGVTQITLPTTPSGQIELINRTGVVVSVDAGSGRAIAGRSRVTSTDFSRQIVTILPSDSVRLIADGTNWIGEQFAPSEVFSYNGTFLSANSSNPNSASDLIHWLGQNYGTQTFSNPSGTARLKSAASSVYGAGFIALPTVLTDRVSGTNAATTWLSEDSASQWVGFELPGLLLPTSLVFQTGNASVTCHPRNFRIQASASAESTFNSQTAVSDWTTLATFTNQTQVTANNTPYSFAITTNSMVRRIAIQSTGQNSCGTSYFGLGEVQLFGRFFL